MFRDKFSNQTIKLVRRTGIVTEAFNGRTTERIWDYLKKEMSSINSNGLLISRIRQKTNGARLQKPGSRYLLSPGNGAKRDTLTPNRAKDNLKYIDAAFTKAV